jgi:hypothetical protein
MSKTVMGDESKKQKQYQQATCNRQQQIKQTNEK